MVRGYYKNRYYKIIIVIFFLIAVLIPSKIFAADLEIKIKGLRSDKGLLRLAIFDLPNEFPRGDQIRSLNIQAKSGNLIAVFKGMAPGIYALAIHHDENKNKEMDTNFVGLPEEGYGFSNDAKVFFGPPYFEAASFIVGNDYKKISLNIIY